MKLPLPLDYPPMEASVAHSVPEGEGWQYEPKWDGFRCLAYRDGSELELMSKASQPLLRYFPEVAGALSELRANQFVLDGELVILAEGRSDFDALLQRIHPAESRVRKLATTTPATFFLFDLLVNDRGEDLTGLPLRQRRRALEEFAARYVSKSNRLVLSPVTRDYARAQDWLSGSGGSIDGIVAKRVEDPYGSGTRDSMVKIKTLRTADCVVGGFRYGAKGHQVGSLLLGLYDDEGLLNHVGFTSSMPSKDRPAITKKLEQAIAPPGFTGAAPGDPSRWSKGRNTEWEPLRPKYVVEVQYDHFSGKRFRHGTKLLRWRPDKKPSDCKLKQVQHESASLDELLKQARRS